MAKKKAKRTLTPFSLFLAFGLVGAACFFVLKLSLMPPCANSLSCKESLTLKIENDVIGTFEGQKVAPPKVDLAESRKPTKVLGEAVLSGDKHIYIDQTNQTLTAYQGDTLVMQTLVSTGKWFPTPTGDFKIWHQVRATRMSGGEGAAAYDLPNVPFVMFFSGSGVSAGRGFGLHGAYWHNNFGHPMSHGCVNMRTVDAEKLFYWVDSDTVITIYGKAP